MTNWRRVNLKVLRKGGKIVRNDDCCCDPCADANCSGCPAKYVVTIAGVGHTNWPPGCDYFVCNGVWELDLTFPLVTDPCGWKKYVPPTVNVWLHCGGNKWSISAQPYCSGAINWEIDSPCPCSPAGNAGCPPLGAYTPLNDGTASVALL